ncbi:hypothetical protein LTR16_006364 [Cryomyces antarcticus]|uniref:Uncharacterized protein n=1 Tax=Cryomyces antarcticus TaxID=329879 RepID=A0ABR0KQF1_9PEZI|nr:hypothetical protein LTR16_006364 [Cryomyces antarcticus]
MPPTSAKSLHELTERYYANKIDLIKLEEKLARDKLALQEKSAKMPVHPAEEEAGSNIFDKVAKESSDSTASTHELHQEDHSHATSGGKASAQDHKATPGPAMSDNLGKPESKEALKARAEELNK